LRDKKGKKQRPKNILASCKFKNAFEKRETNNKSNVTKKEIRYYKYNEALVKELVIPSSNIEYSNFRLIDSIEYFVSAPPNPI
jgi:hypothetical protein